MSKKAIDTSGIINELEGASAFFKPSPTPTLTAKPELPKAPKSERLIQKSPVAPVEPAEDQKIRQDEAKTPADGTPPVRPYARTDNIRIRRTITRYAFEFFQDQIESLKRFSLEEQINGERGSMSQMIREAVDAYIAKRKQMEE